MEITIHQVAELANVSVSTASRILNGGTKGLRADAALRAEKVIAAARQLGYQPNQAARGLVMKRSFCIGFIGTEMENPVRSRLVESLRVAALSKNYQLLVGSVRFGEDIEQALTHLLSQRIDGLILGNISAFPPSMLAVLKNTEMPVVSFGGRQKVDWDSVVMDYTQMGEEITRHLIEVHHYIKIVYAGFGRNYPRRDGYETIMRAAGLAPRFLTADGCTLEAGRVLAKSLLQSGLPEEVVCHNDLLAIGLIAGLRAQKIRVPEDVAVVGFDNIDMADYYNPGLTTIGNRLELGPVLFELLWKRLESPGVSLAQTIICPHQLYLRESCGCNRLHQ